MLVTGCPFIYFIITENSFEKEMFFEVLNSVTYKITTDTKDSGIKENKIKRKRNENRMG